MKTLQRKIMRRVYMSFALSFLEQPLLWVGLVLGASVALFGRLTHVAKLWENFTAVPVGNVPQYAANTFMAAVERGELGTVLVVLAMASLTAIAVYRLSHLKFASKLRTA